MFTYGFSCNHSGIEILQYGFQILCEGRLVVTIVVLKFRCSHSIKLRQSTFSCNHNGKATTRERGGFFLVSMM
jgi:hypothetical protein